MIYLVFQYIFECNIHSSGFQYCWRTVIVWDDVKSFLNVIIQVILKAALRFQKMKPLIINIDIMKIILALWIAWNKKWNKTSYTINLTCFSVFNIKFLWKNSYIFIGKYFVYIKSFVTLLFLNDVFHRT